MLVLSLRNSIRAEAVDQIGKRITNQVWIKVREKVSDQVLQRIFHQILGEVRNEISETR